MFGSQCAPVLLKIYLSRFGTGAMSSRQWAAMIASDESSNFSVLAARVDHAAYVSLVALLTEINMLAFLILCKVNKMESYGLRHIFNGVFAVQKIRTKKTAF